MIILRGTALCKNYSSGQNRIDALAGADFVLHKGEILGIAGESGSGKSTLLKLVSGLEPPDSGELHLFGKPLGPKRSREEYRSIQMIFQDATASFHPRRTLRASILDSAANLLGRGCRVDADALARFVGIDPALLDRYPRSLSGGQCQRLAIARAMAVQPAILLCDEITSALDVSSQAQILRLISGICRDRGMSALFVSHDLAVLSCICDRIMILHEGRIAEEGDARRIIENPENEYTRRLLESVLRIER